jgi:hypothetical protein
MNFLKPRSSQAELNQLLKIKSKKDKLQTTAMLDSRPVMNEENFEKLFHDDLFEEYGIGTQKTYSFMHKKTIL